MWRLAGSCGLDLNSPYAYLLVASHFAGTSVVAEVASPDGSSWLGGFLAAYRPPTSPEALFIWQVAVDVRLRGRGLSRRMLDDALDRPGSAGVTHVEATIAADNAASQGLLHSVASSFDAPVEVSEAFGSDLFPSADHPPELLFRAGPLKPSSPAKPTART